MLRGKRKYNIGEISKISRLSIKALRYYDDKKILVPSERDANTQYRYYSEEQILTALAIHEMQTRGFSLNEVRKVLGAHSLDSITEQYNRHMEEIRAEIAELERKLSLAETSRNLILRAVDYTKDQLEDDPMRNTGRRITVSRMEEQKCIFTRYRSRIYVKEVFWDRFTDIYKLLEEKGYIVSGPIMAVFHEHYTHQFFFEEGDLEILQPISNDENVDDDDENIKTFGGFLVAGLIYVGHYQELLPAYVTLIKWIETNNYEITGDPIEEYLIEFTQGVDASEYVTRIGFPVKKL